MSDENTRNPMQANLGLIGQGSFSPVGIPTPAFVPPTVKHPGEISASISAASQASSMQAVQQSQMTRPGSFGMSPIGGFADAFRANMGAINGSLIGSPFYAQMMARMGGMGPGFNPGMMPSPTQYTDPSMGLYRPFPSSPPSMIPPVPPLPFFRHPLTPSAPMPRFQTPFEYGYNYNQMRGDQFNSAALATPSLGARLGVDYGGSAIGAGLGAAFGGLVGGPWGARFGSTLGALGGLALSEGGGFGRTAQHIVDRLNPARAMALRGSQIQGMSQDWVVGGSGLSPLGMGFGRTSAIHGGRLIEDLAYNNSFRQDTGKAFSAQDLTRITRSAGQAGMLDFAQSPESMRDEVSKIARQLKTFMQVANEPNVQEAIRQMGQLRAMGITIPETPGVMMNARMFARMAGTTVRGITETAGLPGAMMFQQQGLSAGLGMQMGQGMYGMAKQAVAGGAFTVQDIAMLGGSQGIGQRSTEAALALLKIPMIAAALSQATTNGAFGVSGGNIQAVLSGKAGIGDMARMGVENLHSAVSKHGMGALGTFMMQQGELQDNIGRLLGPVGLKTLQMRSVLDVQKTLGFDKSPGGLWMAAKAMGMDDDQAKQFVKEANSPTFFANMRRQAEIQIREMRTMAKGDAERREGGVLDRMSRTRGLTYSAAHGLNRASTAVRSGFQRFNEFFSELGEDWGTPRGEFNLRTPDELLARDDRERRAIRGNMGAALSRYGDQFGGEIDAMRGTASLTGGAHPMGRSRWLGSLRDNVYGGEGNLLDYVRRSEGGMSSLFGGGIMEKIGRTLTGGAGYANAGGISAQAERFGAGALMTRASLESSAGEQTTSLLGGGKKFGMTSGSFNNLSASLAGEIAKIANTKTRLIGGARALTDVDYKQALSSALQSQGISGSQAAAIQGDAGDLFKASISSAKSLTNANAQGAYDTTGAEAFRAGDQKATVAAATEGYDRTVRTLFGEDANADMRDLYGGFIAENNPEAVALAIAFAGAQAGDSNAAQRAEQILASLPANKRKQIEGQANNILDKMGDDKKRYLANAAKSLVSRTGSAAEMIGGIKSNLLKGTMYKGGILIDKGIDQVLGDGYRGVKGMLRGNLSPKGAVAALRALSKEKDLSSVDDETRAAIRAVNRAGITDTDAEAAASKWQQHVMDAGDSNTGLERGGGTRAAGEKGIRGQIAGLTSVQGELAESFPRAVDVFREASLALQDAANRLGVSRSTAYNVDMGQ